ncbi:conjugal transfer protein [Burkholderia diffusa]|uniref:P-type conjugative transfer protein VirB9 n=1 Tax=Burkholderia diffusa TaxID=488732 RepID=UPI000751C17B|nr:P-type conjugative transfer protein VirB9 [Burkholderia diffusa]KWF77588.1 conjugal transfer protein [Burkholderia diffusa]
MKRLLIVVMLAPLLALSTQAMAEVTPSRGDYDARVRIVDYNPDNVVRLTTFYGVSTHVQFGDGEVIRDVAVGDDQAWNIVPRGNHLFIKPKETKADTNVTVVTDKRVYQFALIVQPHDMRNDRAWRDPNLIFSLSFRYPEEEAAKRQAKAEADRLKNRMGDMKAKLADAKHAGGNNDYWVAGSTEVSPTAARDDGRFIYLTFSNNRDMPAVYATDESGAESLINTSVDGNTIVVNRMVRKLTLRKGKAVACIVNKAFDLDGGTDNTNGTIAPSVERVIKGAQ